MREKILKALRHSKADYTEIRLEEKESTQVVFRGKDLENAGALLDKGGVVRCLVHKSGWGVSTFNNLDDLASRVDQAYESAISQERYWVYNAFLAPYLLLPEMNVVAKG